MNPFNFLSNFYNMNQSNKIQELLKKPDVNLDEVLEQNDIDKEFKDGKEYVIKYFDTTKFEALLNYLLKDHHNLEEKKKRLSNFLNYPVKSYHHLQKLFWNFLKQKMKMET